MSNLLIISEWFNNNIILGFLAILPIFVYSSILYFLIPPNHINLVKCQRYFIGGLLSPMLVLFWHFLFPNWLSFIDTKNMYLAFVFLTFIQIGLIEEFFKFLTYKYISKQIKTTPDESPISTMYYVLMSTAGFALLENVLYLMNNGPSVLLIRAFTAICVHLICGIIMGYFIAKSNKYKKTISITFDDEKKRKLILLKNFNIVIGILSASFFHGVYDFNYFIPLNYACDVYAIFIILGGIFIASHFFIKTVKKSIKTK